MYLEPNIWLVQSSMPKITLIKEILCVDTILDRLTYVGQIYCIESIILTLRLKVCLVLLTKDEQHNLTQV
jgi:hypothetical protein